MKRYLKLCLLPLLLLSCAALGKQASNPCSELTLATVQVGCEHRIEEECVAGDKTCPAYVECSKALETWRGCAP